MKKRINLALLSLLLLTGCTSSKKVYPILKHHQEEVVEKFQEEKSRAEEERKKEELKKVNDSDLVLIKDYIPSIYIDLAYATDNNFTHTVIYDNNDAYLRYGTVKKLMIAQEALLKKGYSIKIWDAYRPQEAQIKMWKVCPNSRYVANPYKGGSSHSRGNTVDITLVTKNGEYVEMPSDFDNFTTLADRNYHDVSIEKAQHSQILEEAMVNAGFKPYSAEWWHYSDTTGYEKII